MNTERRIMKDAASRPAVGFFYALLAYGSWGLFPIYWKLFTGISPWVVLSHRVVWSLVVVAVLAILLRQIRETWKILRSFRQVAVLFITATLLSVNWLLFIYGVTSGQVVETSLGYFLTPLVSILLALTILKEKVRSWQIVALVLAGAGVMHFGWHLGRFPWIAVGLAVSFGLYGLLRKMARATPLVGLLIETVLMTPFALLLLFLSQKPQEGATVSFFVLYAGAGVVTTFPLLWYNSAARWLPFSTLGFMQYLVPSLQLVLGTIVFHEPFTMRTAVSFGLIWLAIGIYTVSILPTLRKEMPPGGGYTEKKRN